MGVWAGGGGGGLGFTATQMKNTPDELEQSGLHSAVRCLSAVLALKASPVPFFKS